MTDRVKRPANWGFKQFKLTSGVLAERGKLACGDTSTGKVTKGGTSTTLIPIGWFAETMTGDGTALVNVELFSEIRAAWWDNDTGTPVLETDTFNEAYVKDETIVIMDSTGRSRAGRILQVDSTKGVLIAAGLHVHGPTGAAGASILGAVVADMTALKAIDAASRANGKLVLVCSDGSRWRFAAASTAADTSEQLVATPAVGTGRWIRADTTLTMNLPITFATADAAVLHTVPLGFVLKLAGAPYWDVTTAFTGGSSSSIGLSSSKTGYSTKGDLISASLLAALTAGVRPGTIGDKVDTLGELQALFLEAADTIRHDRIVSAFTAGVGAVRIPILVTTAPASV